MERIGLPVASGDPQVRVRITRQPAISYGLDRDSLLVGRIYNLDSSVASVLMLDGCAELFDALPEEEKREHTDQLTRHGWSAADRARKKWTILPGDPSS